MKERERERERGGRYALVSISGVHDLVDVLVKGGYKEGRGRKFICDYIVNKTRKKSQAERCNEGRNGGKKLMNKVEEWWEDVEE